jgi:hypothetical protein
MLVRDPLATDHSDFFTTRLHQRINRLVTNAVPDTTQLTLRTFLPLVGCEPLSGMRSYTCPDFTAFSLLFKTGGNNAIHQISKFSNGTNSFAVSASNLSLYAKSSGFEETASARVTVGLGEHNSLTIESSDLENLAAARVSFGNVLKLSKNWSIVSQISFFDTAAVGFKFQPCGHMHAAIALTANPWSTKRYLKHVQSSLYFETHKGGVFGCIGTFNLDKSSVPHNISLGLSSRLDYVLPRKIAAKDSGSIVEIPAPVVGMNYDLFKKRVSGYIDFEFAAKPEEAIPRESTQPGPISLKLRIGVSVDQSQWPPTPALSCNLSATESE